jgi:hypothetical protein
MNSRLSPALAEFSEGRWANERGMEPPPRELDRGPWPVSRWVPVAFVRFMILFFIGVVTTLAWQSYGNAARRMVARLTPGLGWLAPPGAPAAPSASGSREPGPAAGASPDQLAALSRSLAAVRQSVDRLAADVAKLQAAKQVPPARTSGPPAAAPPVAVSAQARKPAAQAASSR